ncbi:hypothetical protein AB0J86_37280 [Micromonospora sp. NPDC049559]|uniref:hypothetical protein n=1 Tax=Micromonospora sp. NPDC049559 TaxID=3155923 RepID=UPI003441D322
MSVDELRTGLARIAESVVPDEDPYGQLLRHARRRRRGRIGGLGTAVAALLAAALLGPVVVGGGPGGGGPGDDWVGEGHPITSAWQWRLINSPTRGSLAGDRGLIDELTRAFDRDRAELRMSDSLPKVKILYADESAGFRHVAAVFYSDTSAAVVEQAAPLGTSAEKIVGSDGSFNGPLEPFVVLNVEYGRGPVNQGLLGLAPAGCLVSTADSATVSPDGMVSRQWHRSPTGDYVLLSHASDVRGWWRVECDGQVRLEGPTRYRHDVVPVERYRPGELVDPRPSAPAWPDGEAWQAERAAGTAYQALMDETGLPNSAKPVIRWSGRLDGAALPSAALVGAPSNLGPLVLSVGTAADGALLALGGPGDVKTDLPAPGTGQEDTSLVATAVATTAELAAVRVPALSGGRAVLTDRLLVVPPAGAVRVDAVSGDDAGGAAASAPVRDGAAILTLPLGAKVTLRALAGDGSTLASAPLRELARGERIFNEAVTSNW